MKKIVFLIAAGVFFIMGVIGLLIPVIPQVPLFAISALFACAGSEKIRRKIRHSAVYEKYLKKYIDNSKFASSIFNDPDEEPK